MQIAEVLTDFSCELIIAFKETNNFLHKVVISNSANNVLNMTLTQKYFLLQSAIEVQCRKWSICYF